MGEAGISLDPTVEGRLRKAQRNEITEYQVYSRLAESTRDPRNKEVLEQVGADELKHYELLGRYTGREIRPSRARVLGYVMLSRIFGLTFGLKLMEKGEARAQEFYGALARSIPEISAIGSDEDEHETQLLGLLDEERLRYVSSIVLGLNDALVELTGALAGFSLALRDTRLVAATGLITGIAASLSMATSEYLSTKSEADGKSPGRASIYTGTAYVLTVIFLIFPFLVLTRVYAALTVSILNAILVIFIFTFYVSVARDLSFRGRFLEMAGISLGVAALTFGIGYLVSALLGV